MSPCWDTEESSRFNAIGPLPLPILSQISHSYHEVPALLSALAPVSAVLVYAHPPPPPTSDLVLFSCYRYPSLGLLFPAGSGLPNACRVARGGLGPLLYLFSLQGPAKIVRCVQ